MVQIHLGAPRARSLVAKAPARRAGDRWFESSRAYHKPLWRNGSVSLLQGEGEGSTPSRGTINFLRAVAQLGRAPALGAGSRWFKSSQPDHAPFVHWLGPLVFSEKKAGRNRYGVPSAWSFNGKTADSGSANRGSIPCRATINACSSNGKTQGFGPWDRGSIPRRATTGHDGPVDLLILIKSACWVQLPGARPFYERRYVMRKRKRKRGKPKCLRSSTVEHPAFNRLVEGSIPSGGTI